MSGSSKRNTPYYNKSVFGVSVGCEHEINIQRAAIKITFAIIWVVLYSV